MSFTAADLAAVWQQPALLLQILFVSGLPLWMLTFWPGWKRASAATRHLLWLLVLVTPVFWEVLWAMTVCLEQYGKELAALWGLGVLSSWLISAKRISPFSWHSYHIYRLLRHLLRGWLLVWLWGALLWLSYSRLVEVKPSFSLASLLASVWAIGYLLLMLRWLQGIASVWFLSRRWNHWRTRWTRVLGMPDFSYAYGNLRFRKANAETPQMPMTWGFLRPVVLLPEDFAAWSAERQQAVLQHELAHVARKDWLWQMIAHFACALYWFNPLFWHASRQLQAESEQACDDRVILAGTSSVDYADHLLAVLRSVRGIRSPRMLVAPMAQSLVETRVKSILEPERNRRELSGRRVIGSLLFYGTLLFLLGSSTKLVSFSPLLLLSTLTLLLSEPFLRWTAGQERKLLRKHVDRRGWRWWSLGVRPSDQKRDTETARASEPDRFEVEASETAEKESGLLLFGIFLFCVGTGLLLMLHAIGYDTLK